MDLEMLLTWNEKIARKMKNLKKMTFRLFECFGGVDRFKAITHQEWHDRIYSHNSIMCAMIFILEMKSWQDFQQNVLVSLWPSSEKLGSLLSDNIREEEHEREKEREEGKNIDDLSSSMRVLAFEERASLEHKQEQQQEIHDWNSSAGIFLRGRMRETCHDLIKYISWCEIKANAVDNNDEDAPFVFALKDCMDFPEDHYKLNHCFCDLEKLLVKIYPTGSLKSQYCIDLYSYMMSGSEEGEEIFSLYWGCKLND
jgi:hypothetical protein